MALAGQVARTCLFWALLDRLLGSVHRSIGPGRKGPTSKWLLAPWVEKGTVCLKLVGVLLGRKGKVALQRLFPISKSLGRDCPWLGR